MEQETEEEPLLVPVLAAHRFDEEALATYLRRELPGFHGQLEVQQYYGGASNPTYLLATVGSCANALPEICFPQRIRLIVSIGSCMH